MDIQLSGKRCFKESHINSSRRLSNRSDENKIGVLRSSAFKVTTQRLASMRLGATKHRDVTYVSLKEVGTNNEVFRFFSDRWKESDEEATHLYYIDLIPYKNKALYFEFIDNSRADWGLLTLEEIVTDIETLPHINDEIAFNLLSFDTKDYIVQCEITLILLLMKLVMKQLESLLKKHFTLLLMELAIIKEMAKCYSKK